jgi:hypothetical protein
MCLQKAKLPGKVDENYLNVLSMVLVGLGIWLIVDGVLSTVKYSKQTYPEQLIRVVRAIVGVVIVVIGIVGN